MRYSVIPVSAVCTAVVTAVTSLADTVREKVLLLAQNCVHVFSMTHCDALMLLQFFFFT